MYFDPTRCTCDVLAVVFSSPAFNKAHTNCAHFCELVDSFKALIHTLCQELGKFLVVEDFQAASRGNLAHCGRMKTVRVIAIATLDKNSTITQALSKNLSSNVKQVHSFSNVASDILNGGVSVDIGEQAQTKPVSIHAWVCISIHYHVRAGGMKSFTNSLVQFIVAD